MSATELVRRMRESATASPAASAAPAPDVLARGVAAFAQSYDARHGGFGSAPKFPRPSELLFLLREHARTGEPVPRDLALHALRAMALGGMRDHVGGGFHRYSVDEAWRVPHFEKMLYDQAQLVLAYLEAAQATGDRFFAQVAEDTLQYVGRELTHPDGGFYSAEDADSLPPGAPPGGHKVEGAFYVWSAGELRDVLGGDADVVAPRFGVEEGGNAPFDPQGEFTGKNLFYTAASVEDIVATTGRTAEDVIDALGRARLVLFGARLHRPRPHLDDKVLAAWNGLMIAAFARAARVLARAAVRPARHRERTPGNGAARGPIPSRPAVGRPAPGAVATLQGRRCGRGRLRRGLRGSGVRPARVVPGRRRPRSGWSGPTSCRRSSTSGSTTRSTAAGSARRARTRAVLVRSKEDYDGAEPSPTALALLNLQVLTHLRPDADRTARIGQSIARFGTRLGEYSRAVPLVLAALVGEEAGIGQLVIVEADGGAEAAAALRDVAAEHYRPFLVEVPVTPAHAQTLARSAAAGRRDGAGRRAVGRVSLRQLHVPGAGDDAGGAARRSSCSRRPYVGRNFVRQAGTSVPALARNRA